MKHIEADVVLVGGGMSGLCSATQAQESLNATGGGSVVVFEKSGTIGGAANMGMAFFAVESQLQKETMTNNYTKDDAFNFFMEYTHWRSDAKLVRRWFNMSGDSVKWMQDKGVEFLGVFKYFKNSKETQHMVKVPGANKPTERCASVMIKTVTDYALLFLRGERPVMDRKYNILKHPNVHLSADGKGNPYIHGGAKSANNSITFVGSPTKLSKAASKSEAASFYTILSSEELESQLDKEEPV